jgi:hypothetical protein
VPACSSSPFLVADAVQALDESVAELSAADSIRLLTALDSVPTLASRNGPDVALGTATLWHPTGLRDYHFPCQVGFLEQRPAASCGARLPDRRCAESVAPTVLRNLELPLE